MRLTFLKLFTLLLACNYFAFRVELFQDEYERFHPAPTSVPSINILSLNWETFDKDNAPKAFVVNPEVSILFLSFAPKQTAITIPACSPCNLIRDKSPPFYLINS